MASSVTSFRDLIFSASYDSQQSQNTTTLTTISATESPDETTAHDSFSRSRHSSVWSHVTDDNSETSINTSPLLGNVQLPTSLRRRKRRQMRYRSKGSRQATHTRNRVLIYKNMSTLDVTKFKQTDSIVMRRVWQEMHTKDLVDRAQRRLDKLDELAKDLHQPYTTYRATLLAAFWKVFVVMVSCIGIVFGIVVRYYLLDLILYIASYVIDPNYDVYKEFVRLEAIPHEFDFEDLVMLDSGWVIFFPSAYILVTIVMQFTTRIRSNYTYVIGLIIMCVLIVGEQTTVSLSMKESDVQHLRKLRDYLQHNYKFNSTAPYSVVMDLYSIAMECCGIINSFDIPPQILQNSNFKFHSMVPPSCCNFHQYVKGRDSVIHCMVTMEDTHEHGCFEHLQEVHLMWSEKFSFVVISTHLLDNILTLMEFRRYMKRRAKYNRHEQKLETINGQIKLLVNDYPGKQLDFDPRRISIKRRVSIKKPPSEIDTHLNFRLRTKSRYVRPTPHSSPPSGKKSAMLNKP